MGAVCQMGPHSHPTHCTEHSASHYFEESRKPGQVGNPPGSSWLDASPAAPAGGAQGSGLLS